MTVTEAITKGQENAGPIPDELKVTKVEVKEPDKETTNEAPKVETTAVELTEKELEEAQILYKQLKNPDTRDATAAYIASLAGITKAEARVAAPEVKAAVAEVIKEADDPDDVLKILKGKLGTEFDFLAEKLAPALEEIVEKRIAKVGAIAESIKQDRERDVFEKQTLTALDTIGEKFYKGDIPTDVQQEMSKVMDKLKYDTEMTAAEYIENVHFVALGKLGKSPLATKITAQVTPPKKASETIPRNKPVPETEIIPKGKGLTKVIEYAMEQAEAKGFKLQ